MKLPKKGSLDPSELKIALDNRAFEIQLFWQRSNYFLVLMTALGIGTFSVKDYLFSPVIALFTTACSYFWFRTNLGSKFWQESWEVEVSELSKELGVRSFERPLSEVRDQVRRSLASGQESEKRSSIRKWIDSATVKKYSVTYNMILLSLVSTVLWFFVAIALTVRSLTGGYAELRTMPAIPESSRASNLTPKSPLNVPDPPNSAAPSNSVTPEPNAAPPIRPTP